MRTATTQWSKKRRRTLLAGAVLTLALLGAACVPYADATPPPPGCPSGPADPISGTILNRTNADREARGLKGLWWSPRLACVAIEWSNFMAGTGQFRHRDLGSTIRSPGFEDYSGLAENILVGPGNMDGNAIHNAWMNSPGHYANIVGNWDVVGIGVVQGWDGRLWVTTNFGRKM